MLDNTNIRLLTLRQLLLCAGLMVGVTLHAQNSLLPDFKPNTTVTVSHVRSYNDSLLVAFQCIDTLQQTPINYCAIGLFKEGDNTLRYLTLSDTLPMQQGIYVPKQLEISPTQISLTGYLVQNAYADSPDFTLFVMRTSMPDYKRSTTLIPLFKRTRLLPSILKLKQLNTDNALFYYGNYSTGLNQYGGFIVKTNLRDSVLQYWVNDGSLDAVNGYPQGTVMHINDTLFLFNASSAYAELNKRSPENLNLFAAYNLTRGFSPQLGQNHLQATNTQEHTSFQSGTNIYQFITTDTVYSPNPPAADYLHRYAIRKYNYRLGTVTAGKPLLLNPDDFTDQTAPFYWLPATHMVVREKINEVFVLTNLINYSQQLYLARLDTNLNLIWQRGYMAESNNSSIRYVAHDMNVTDQGIYLCGKIIGRPQITPFLIKIGKDGTLTGHSEAMNRTTLKGFVYPNPSSGIVNLPPNAKHIEVRNPIGQVILTTPGSEYIDLRPYPPSMYYLRYTLEGTNYSCTIIRN